MKLNMKRLAIILVVAAVAAYLVWKGKKAKDGGGGETEAPSTGALAKNSTEAIIDALDLGAADSHKKYLRMYCSQFEASMASRAEIEGKAEKNGVTYAQQAVMDASYLTYYVSAGNGVWTEKFEGASAYHKKVVDQVRAMA